MKRIVYIFLVIFISLIFSGCWGNKSSQSDDRNLDSPNSIQVQALGEKVPLDLVKDRYSKGPAEAKVTIVDFSDFQCPACAQMSKILDQIQQDFPNEVKIVYRHFPLSYHKYAKQAAYAAEAAGEQEKFWPMHDAIFANYNDLDENKILELAGQISLDIDQFNKDRSSSQISQRVADDLIDGESLLIDATPTFYFNNQKYQGDYSLEVMEDVVRDLLGKYE